MLRQPPGVHNPSTVVGQTAIEGDDIMQDRSPANRWAPAVFALFFAAIVGLAVGTWAYNLGLSHGLAERLPPPSAGAYPWAYYRPWGFGPFFPLLFLLFWFAALRFLFRGGPWRRGWGGYYGGRLPHDVPPMFEEWHRRAHERESSTPPPATA
jgi:hypothetical protein